MERKTKLQDLYNAIKIQYKAYDQLWINNHDSGKVGFGIFHSFFFLLLLHIDQSIIWNKDVNILKCSINLVKPRHCKSVELMVSLKVISGSNLYTCKHTQCLRLCFNCLVKGFEKKNEVNLVLYVLINNLPYQELHREAGVRAAGSANSRETVERAEASDPSRPHAATYPWALLLPGYQTEGQRGESSWSIHWDCEQWGVQNCDGWD